MSSDATSECCGCTAPYAIKSTYLNMDVLGLDRCVGGEREVRVFRGGIGPMYRPVFAQLGADARVDLNADILPRDCYLTYWLLIAVIASA